MLMFMLISIGLSGAATLIVGVHATVNSKQLSVPNISVFILITQKMDCFLFLLYDDSLNVA